MFLYSKARRHQTRKEGKEGLMLLRVWNKEKGAYNGKWGPGQAEVGAGKKKDLEFWID